MPRTEADIRLLSGFLVAIESLGPREAAKETGLSHETIRKYRKDEWLRITAKNRRKMRAYLADSATAQQPHHNDEATRILEKIRKLVAVPQAPNLSAVNQPAEIQPSETKPLGVAMLEGYQNNPKKQHEIRERFGNHELVLVAYVHARMLGMVARGELGQSDWDRWDGFTIGKDYFPDEGLGPAIPPEEADEFERVTKTNATE